MNEYKNHQILRERLISLINEYTPNRILKSMNWKLVIEDLRKEPYIDEYREELYLDSVLEGFHDPHMQLIKNKKIQKFYPLMFETIDNDIHVYELNNKDKEYLGVLKSIEEVANNCIYFSSETEKLKRDGRSYYFTTKYIHKILQLNDQILIETTQNSKMNRKIIKSLSIPSNDDVINNSEVNSVSKVYYYANYFNPISFFAMGSADLFIKEIRKFDSDKPLILDLRYCSGGIVKEANRFISYFCEDNFQYGEKIIKENGKDIIKIMKTDKVQPKLNFSTIYILTNKYTMSCAEFIVVQALKCSDLNVIHIGKPTFGAFTEAKVIKLNKQYTCHIICSYINNSGSIIPQYECNDATVLKDYSTEKDPMIQMIKKIEVKEYVQ